jgi:hypothetical protein
LALRKLMTSTLVALVVLIVLSTLVVSSSAADYTKVGVKAGDTADYKIVSSNPKMNGAVIHASIQKVEGTVVTINGSVHYTNGTVQAEFISGDISLGQNSSYYFLICANLTRGDPIYVDSKMNITETASMSVLGVSREVNHLSSSSILGRFDVYWDKLSGLMTRLEASSWGFQITIAITSTSLWIASSQTQGGTNSTGGTGSTGSAANGVVGWLVIGMVVTVWLVIIVIVLRDRRR